MTSKDSEPEYEYGVMADEDEFIDVMLAGDFTYIKAAEAYAVRWRACPDVRNVRIVRRAVGEWEDVPGEEQER